jgi:hypothetical protein
MLPPGSFVYQTPHAMFPEVRPFHREPSYSPMRLYLHSTALRWSYGGIKGRAGDNWHVLLAQVPVRDRVATLRAAGFAGVVVARRALADGGRQTELALSDVGLERPSSSPDGSFAFYRVSKTPPDEEDVLLLAVGGRGFYPVEGVYPRHWYWSNGPAELLILNPFPQSQPIDAAFSLRSLTARQVHVHWPNGRSQNLTVGGEPVPVSSKVSAQPGWSVIRFDTDRPAAAPDGSSDRRRLAFMVSDIDCCSEARTR